MDTSNRLSLVTGALRIAEIDLAPEKRMQVFIEWMWHNSRVVRLIHGRALKDAFPPESTQHEPNFSSDDDRITMTSPTVALCTGGWEQREPREIGSRPGAKEVRGDRAYLMLDVRGPKIFLWRHETLSRCASSEDVYELISWLATVSSFKDDEALYAHSKEHDFSLRMALQQIAEDAQRSAEAKLKRASMDALALSGLAAKTQQRAERVLVGPSWS